MKIFNELAIKFKRSDWALNPEFGLIDTLLDHHSELIELLVPDVTKGTNASEFGRKDTPTVEQIVRAAIFKEMKGLNYRELEYAQSDSRICATFIKLDERKPLSFQVLQKYISKITPESLEKLMVEINRIAISEGLEDVEKLRQDSTVVKANIHYPTNNALVWDCIKESHRLLKQLNEECDDLSYRDYTGSAKKTYFKINVTKSKDRRVELFKKQLITFTKCINQVANSVKKRVVSPKGIALQCVLEDLLPLMEQVYSMTYRKELLGEVVPNDEKLFSIYERHTDIIVKGSREVDFGHKVSLAGGRSNLILDCQILTGNPSDSTLYQPTLERVIAHYQTVPRDSVTDGAYASLDNVDYSLNHGITNVVFNKVVGSLKSHVTSKCMETRLKKWRSGIEAVISNLKRGFDLFVCEWKGWIHFQAKVLWSVIAYNFRVMTSIILERIQTQSALV